MLKNGKYCNESNIQKSIGFAYCGGYFTGKNGTGTQYVAADGNINDVYKTSDSKTLYAYWIENSGETGDVNSDGVINSNDAL